MSEKINVNNATFEIFIPGSGAYPRLNKLKDQFVRKEAYDLVKFCKVITSSPEFQAYAERREEIIKAEQEKIKENPKYNNGIISAATVPEWAELMNLDSGLEIEKHKINVNKIPEWKDEKRMLTANDMEILDFIFEFVDDEV